MKTAWSRLLLTVCVVGLVSCSIEDTAEMAADTVLLNGKILTVDEAFTIVEALAIEGERIVAVGSSDAISQYVGTLAWRPAEHKPP